MIALLIKKIIIQKRVQSIQTRSDTDLKDSAKYTEDRHSSVVSDVKKEINQVEEQDMSDSTKKNN